MDFKEFEKRFNIKLNNEQLSAVKRADGQTLLLAVPGSGKTTVIVARTGYMIYCKEINPCSILTVTYSKAATADMKKRYVKVFGSEFSDLLTFRTIHSLCYEIIRHYVAINNSTAFNVVSQGQSAVILREIYKDLRHDFLTEYQLKEIKTKITFAVNMCLDKDAIKEMDDDDNFSDIYFRYQKIKVDNRLMDYDDQLKYAFNILRTKPEILDYFQKKYQYISVDEAQDTSKIQHLIIRLLSLKYKNIFMVGDEDQSIYGFRAAFPQALLDFAKVYPDGKVLKMEQNYRSTKEIVSHANNFIKLNTQRYNKNMITDNKQGKKINLKEFSTYDNQIQYILECAKNADCKTAILYRNNESAIPLIDIFEANGVEYNIREGDFVFFSHFIIKDICAFIKLSLNSYDTEAFTQICFKTGCGITKIQRDAFLLKYRGNKPVLDSLLETDLYGWQKKKIMYLRQSFSGIKVLKPFYAIKKILYSMGYNDFLTVKKTDNEDTKSLGGINPYEQKISTILMIAKRAEKLDEFLLRINALKDIISLHKNSPCNVILSTIHASKGLEYDKVILIDVQDGQFPSFTEKQAKNKLSKEDRNILEEERRLFYVAVTRAKTNLNIISCKNKFIKEQNLSYFIKDFLGIKKETKKPLKKSTLKVQSSLTEKNYKEERKKFTAGTKIHHRVYGEGKIMSINENVAYINIKGKTSQYDIDVCIKNNIISVCE